MRAAFVVGAMSVGAVVSSDASGADVDYPTLATFSKASEPGVTQVTCSPIQTAGRGRIHCTFAQTAIEPHPSSPEIEKRIADAEGLAKTRPAEAIRNACGPSPPTPAIAGEIEGEADGPDKNLSRALLAACRAGNVTLALQVFVDFQRQIASHTCRFSQTMWEANFERVDLNTWISTTGPEGGCHVSYVETLWHEEGKPYLWNYRQVSTQPDPAKDDMACKTIAGTHVSEYSWRNRRTRDLGCQYFDL